MKTTKILSFDEHKAFLLKIVTTLPKLRDEYTDRIVPHLKVITDDCCNRIAFCPIKDLCDIVQWWYKIYLFFYDECRVLYTGELTRKCHKEEHKDFIHFRSEQEWQDKGTLSACSYDGLESEYHKFMRLYNKSKSVHAISTFMDSFQSPMNERCKDVKSYIGQFTKALSKRKREISFLLLDDVYKLESLKVTYVDSGAHFVADRKQSCTRKAAWEGTLELERKLGTDTQLQQRNSHSSKPRNFLVVLDEDELKEKVDNVAASLLAQQQEFEEQRKRSLDFGVDVNVEALKRGVAAMEDDESEDEQDKGEAPTDVANSWNSSGVRRYLHSLPIAASHAASLNKRTVKLRVFSPLSSSGADKSVVPPGERLRVSVDLLCFSNLVADIPLPHVGDPEEWCSVSELLAEVRSQLWYKQLSAADSDVAPVTGSPARQLWLPISVIANRKQYFQGDIMPLPPLIPEQRAKVWRVVCEKSPPATSFLRSLRASLDQQWGDTSAADRLESLQSHHWLVDEMAKRLSEDMGAADCAILDVSSCEDVSAPDEAMVRVLMESLTDTLAPRLLHLRANGALAGHLRLLLQHCDSVDLSCCGVSHLDLLRFQSTCTRDSHNSSVKCGARIVSLRHNKFMSYCEHAWLVPSETFTAGESHGAMGMDCFSLFAESLVTECASLETLDLTGCADTELQSERMSLGLVAALRLRSQSQLPPLRKITVGGWQKQFPTICRAMKTALVSEEMGQLIGTSELDCGGGWTSMLV